MIIPALHRFALAISSVLIIFLLVYFNYDNLHELILGQVFRSAQPSGSDLHVLTRDHQIRSVINLRGPWPNHDWYREERKVAAELDIVHYDVDLKPDELPKYRELERLLMLIQTAPRPVLLHCKAGADRAGLASVIALIFDGEPDLALALEQISIRYLVATEDSIGVQVFRQYGHWLSSTQTVHSAETFLHWVDSSYQDLQGNLEHYVDGVNGVAIEESGMRYEDNYTIQINRTTTPALQVQGWAIDTGNHNTLASIELVLGVKSLGMAKTNLSRPGVAEYIGDPVYTNSGWTHTVSTHSLPDGCHHLSLRLVRHDQSYEQTSPKARICTGSD